MATPFQATGRHALNAFKHFNVRAGEVLMRGNFTAYAMSHNIRTDDMSADIAFGYAQGWFEDGLNGTVKLTPEGYKQV